MTDNTEITAGLPSGTYAVFETNQGTFVIHLFVDKVPNTCANFIGLAEGTKEFMNPKTRAKEKSPFYDGLTFHRVIKNFMIQGGCPEGTGRGGPGYRFEDEFDPTLRHNKPGILSMANAGPGTNGSQFFITVAPTPHLDNHHTVFGEVVKGYEVVDAISKLPTTSGDRPMKDVVINHLRIERI